MALFACDISEFNFKRNAAKPEVVTRTFFRHLNIVALNEYVYHLFLSEVDFILRYGSTSFSLAYDSLPEKRSAGRRFYFSFPAASPPPTPSDILSFSPQFSHSAGNPKWRQNSQKTTKTACTAGYDVSGLVAFNLRTSRTHR